MRFIHTSDWHLGRLFYGEYLTDEQAHILDQFVDLVRDVRPDAIVIAGDIYDRGVPPTGAVELLDEIISRILLDCHTPVIAIAGNHDSPERIGFGNKLLARQGLHVVGPLTGTYQPVTLADEHGPVYFVPLTYAEPATVRLNLAAEEASDHTAAMACYIRHATQAVPAGARKVAVAHAFLTGGEPSESERPLSVGGSSMVNASLFSSFHYTALGHLHRPQAVGAPHIRYSGSLMKYSFAEAGHKKGVYMVEMDKAGAVRIETVELRPRRDVRCIKGMFQDLMKGPQNNENREDYILAELHDTLPVLDALGQLRSIYPNVLSIDPRYRASGGENGGTAVDHRKLTEKDLFAAFAEQMTGTALSAEQTAALDGVLEELIREGREE
ncbi:exodeoxyribonuclease I subunit D [Anaerospora hongkongensis]|uniref:Nuclease SbcCD subunit D n=1 Tax=Anaerospora hongkongensis TaxID=244830 RepID=A0A4R1Q3M8_9FIRM|nr:exonuclease SbcCD subunit D [Anaerospora hongkongensis]TCL38612.1 exodeoxyribonuclease I subunit D [Anaerospora hongkongensis]